MFAGRQWRLGFVGKFDLAKVNGFQPLLLVSPVFAPFPYTKTPRPRRGVAGCRVLLFSPPLIVATE